MSGARDTYPVCGSAVRLAFERAYAAGCTRKQLRALGAVIGWTTSWSRLEDDVYVAEIARDAGLHIVDARAALRRLRDLGIIEYEGRRNRPSRIGLPRGDSASFGKRGDSASLGDLRGVSASPHGGEAASLTEAVSPLCNEKFRGVSDSRAHAREHRGVCPECEVGGGRHIEGCSLVQHRPTASPLGETGER